MNASRCAHWLDLSGHTFDCDLNLGHHGKHVAYKGGEGVGDRPRGGKARKNVGVRIEWDRPAIHENNRYLLRILRAMEGIDIQSITYTRNGYTGSIRLGFWVQTCADYEAAVKATAAKEAKERRRTLSDRTRWADIDNDAHVSHLCHTGLSCWEVSAA